VPVENLGRAHRIVVRQLLRQNHRSAALDALHVDLSVVLWNTELIESAAQPARGVLNQVDVAEARALQIAQRALSVIPGLEQPYHVFRHESSSFT